MLHQFVDIHTHTPGIPGSILSIPASGVERIVLSNQSLPPHQQQYYSLQLHPWHLTDESEIAMFIETAHRFQSDPHFVAIGECGLDSLCQTPLPLQHSAFKAALLMAQELQKPTIIHCVRLWAEMMADVKECIQSAANATSSVALSPPLIIHGFRKGPALARQLLDAGFSISLGQNYHPAVCSIIPQARLYHETDAEIC